MAVANHRDLKSRNTVFEDIAILSRVANCNLTGDGQPERLPAARIAANLFLMLRVTPALGRGFTEDENQPGQDRVVFLSHRLWQRRYAGDPNILGKTIRLENRNRSQDSDEGNVGTRGNSESSGRFETE